MRAGGDARFVICAGFLVVLIARLMLPSAPPLYDGVVPIEPYQWLVPPAGALGGAAGTAATLKVLGGRSPLVAVTTAESPPQAQIFAEPGAITLPAGAATLKVSIEPVVLGTAPPDGHLDGNVYRILVTDDRGTLLSAPPAAGVSVVLRATDPTTAQATIALLQNGAWERLATSTTGLGGTFIAVVSTFGEFAIILPGPASGAAGSAPSPVSSLQASLPSTSPGQQPIAPSPPSSSDGDNAGVAGWLLAGLAVFVLVAALIRSRLGARRERTRYRGARPTRK